MFRIRKQWSVAGCYGGLRVQNAYLLRTGQQSMVEQTAHEPNVFQAAPASASVESYTQAKGVMQGAETAAESQLGQFIDSLAQLDAQQIAILLTEKTFWSVVGGKLVELASECWLLIVSVISEFL